MNISTIGIYSALGISTLIAIWAIFVARNKNSTIHQFLTGFGMLDKSSTFFTIFATTFSAFTVVGLPAMFYAHGIGTFWFMWIGIALTPWTMRFIGKKIVKMSMASDGKFTSPIGLLTAGYKSQLLTMTLSLLTIVVLFPYLTLQIAGIGKFVISVSDGKLSYVFGTLFCSVLVGLYTILGGAKADAVTDKIQGILLIAGTIALGIAMYILVNSQFIENIRILSDKELLTIPGPKGYFSLPVLISFGIIFTLISISTPQVSQKLMSIDDWDKFKPLKSWWLYPLIGSVVVLLAGFIGLYAAANLNISSPDFVAGDVIRHLASNLSGFYSVIFFIVAILFMAAVLSAAISTIDSLLLAISGIVKDNFYKDNETKNLRLYLKIFAVFLLVGGLLFSSQPPMFIVSLAQIQLAGLTALLPCLLGPMFGITNKIAGWFAISFGIISVIVIKFTNISIWGFDVGIAGLILGIAGLLMGRLIFGKE